MSNRAEDNVIRLISAYLPNEAPDNLPLDDYASFFRVCEQDKGVYESLVGDESRKKEILTWLTYVKNDLQPAIESKQINKLRPCLSKLNKQIEPIVYLVSNRLSLADLFLFGFLSEAVLGWSQDETFVNDNISRWYDNIQHLPAIHQTVIDSGLYVNINKNVPKPQVEQKGAQKGKEDQKGKKTEVKEKKENQEGQTHSSPAPVQQQNQPSSATTNEAAQGKGKPQVFSRLDMRVGRIVKVEKHPNANNLYVEEIDIGESKKRSVVSGLAKFVPLEEMQNRLVVVLCNIKPSKMRNVKSEAMVICGSNDDHTAVEILDPPASSSPGDHIIVEGDTGVPDRNINLGSSDNIFKALQPVLRTNNECIAVFKGKPLTVPSGIFTVKTLKNANLG